MTILTCPYCGYKTKQGLQVCKGCNADIVYGDTPSETNTKIMTSLFLGLVGGFSLEHYVFGLSWFGDWFFIRLLLNAFAGMLLTILLWKSHEGPRFFRRFNNY